MGKYSILLGCLVILFAASFCQADDEKATAGVANLDTFVDHFLHHIYKKHPLFKKPEPPVHKPDPKEPKKPETGKKPKPSGPKKKQEEKKSKPENKKAKPQEPKKPQPSIKKKPCPIFHGIPEKIHKKFGSIPKIPLPPHA